MKPNPYPVNHYPFPAIRAKELWISCSECLLEFFQQCDNYKAVCVICLQLGELIISNILWQNMAVHKNKRVNAYLNKNICAGRCMKFLRVGNRQQMNLGMREVRIKCCCRWRQLLLLLVLNMLWQTWSSKLESMTIVCALWSQTICQKSCAVASSGCCVIINSRNLWKPVKIMNTQKKLILFLILHHNACKQLNSCGYLL
jgi:hypothetical protein